MKGISAGLVMALGLAACSSDEESHGPCAQRQGSYVATYTARGGTCGAVPETVITLDAQPVRIEAPCVGNISYTSDNCHVAYAQTCPRPAGALGVVHVTGGSNWTIDALQAGAVERWVVADETGKWLCEGTYDVSFVRQ